MVPGTLALAVIQLWSSAHVPDPTIVFDENGYLGNARWLAGGSTWEMPFAPAYSSAYSVVLAPVMAIVGDPSAQWVGVRVVNALLLASVFPLVYLVLRQVLDVPRNRALAAAFVGALVPATFSAGFSGVAENLVLPLVPATVLTIWWMLDPGRPWPLRVLAGPATALLYATHPRFTLAVPLLVLLLTWIVFRGMVRPAIVLANGAGLVCGVAGSRLLDGAVQSARWRGGTEKLEGDLGDWLDLVTTRDGLAELVLTATGQLWYLAVGSLGLSLVGLAWFGRRAWTSRAAPGPGPARSVVLTATLGLAGSVFVTSVLFFAQNQFRPDHFVYGRHNDSFSPLWVAAGVALVLGHATHRRSQALLASATAFIVVSGVALATTRDAEALDDVFSPFAVPAITRFVQIDPATTIIRSTALAALGSLVIIAGLVGLRRLRSARAASAGRAGFVVAMGAWFAFMALAPVFATGAFHGVIYDDWDPVSTLDRIGVDELCIDDAAGRGGANLFYAWALPEVAVRASSGEAGGASPCTFTIAAVDDPVRLGAGDRLALLDEGGVYPRSGMPEGVGVWVAPGPTGDRLERRGALLPDGFPGELPDRAQRTAISIEGAPAEPIRVEAGRHFDVDLTVTHAGEGTPWADAASFARDGRVELLARWRPVDQSGDPSTTSAGPLPRWMWPGDTVATTAKVFAVDETLTPLPSGRYEVRLGVGQIGHEWFAPGGPEATFVVEVTI